MTVSIGKVYAICDHLEKSLGKPTTAGVLRRATGVDREQLRSWTREGKLNEFEVTDLKGQMQRAYTRPKLEDGVTNGRDKVEKVIG